MSELKRSAKEVVSPVLLNLVVLRTRDLPRAADFYSVLGLAFEKHAHGKGPEHFAASLGSTVFELYPQAGEEESTKNVRIGFQVIDAASALASLERKGAKIVSPLKDSPWGLRAVIDDPFGHRVEISQAKTEPNPESSVSRSRHMTPVEQAPGRE